MITPERDETQGESQRRRFQYSLRTLLLVTTVLAVACAVFLTAPIGVGTLAALMIVISTPMVLTIVIVYGRGYVRTFSIGALFPAGYWCLRLLSSQPRFDPFAYFPSDGGVDPWLEVVRAVMGAMLDEMFTPSVEGRGLTLAFVSIYAVVLVLNGLLAVLVRWWLRG